MVHERLVFDADLYREDAVRAAAVAYAELASIEVEVGDEGIVATLTRFEPEIAEQLVDHFCNHALHETVARVRDVA